MKYRLDLLVTKAQLEAIKAALHWHQQELSLSDAPTTATKNAATAFENAVTKCLTGKNK